MRGHGSISCTSLMPRAAAGSPGTAGFEDAARYMADRFREIGLEPAGDDGTYFQRFPVKLVDLAGTPALSRTGAAAKSLDASR